MKEPENPNEISLHLNEIFNESKDLATNEICSWVGMK